MNASTLTNYIAVAVAASWVVTSGYLVFKSQLRSRMPLIYIVASAALMAGTFHWVHASAIQSSLAAANLAKLIPLSTQVGFILIKFTLFISTFTYFFIYAKSLVVSRRCFQMVLAITSLTFVSLVVNLTT